MSKTTHVRQQIFIAPAAADSTSVVASITTATVTTAGITNPTNPRTIRVVSGGASHNASGNVVINGTDIAGNTIASTVTLNGNTPVDSDKAFATITSVDTTGVSGIDASATVTVGRGAALGLDCYADAYSFVGLTEQSSFAYDATTLSKNVVTLSASLDGVTNQAILYVPSVFPTYSRIYG